MNETSDQNSPQGEHPSEACCPLCRFMQTMRGATWKHNEFCTHIRNAQIELLRAFQSLAQQGIECLEKRQGSASEEKRASRIVVE